MLSEETRAHLEKVLRRYEGFFGWILLDEISFLV